MFNSLDVSVAGQQPEMTKTPFLHSFIYFVLVFFFASVVKDTGMEIVPLMVSHFHRCVSADMALRRHHVSKG